MLREFEDQENLLSEMDEQVDAYRDSGKLEAAARLEDQLLLIHEKFQVRTSNPSLSESCLRFNLDFLGASNEV